MASALDQLEGVPVRPLTVPVADSIPVDDTTPATHADSQESLSGKADTPLERLPPKWRKFGMSNFKTKSKTKENIEGRNPTDPTVTSAEANDISTRPVTDVSDGATPRGTTPAMKDCKADAKKGGKSKSDKRPQSAKKTETKQAEKEKKDCRFSTSTICLDADALGPKVDTTAKPEKSKQAKTPTVKQASVVPLRFQKDAVTSSRKLTASATNGFAGTTVRIKDGPERLMTRSLRSKKARAEIDEDIENKAHLEEMMNDPERPLRKCRGVKQNAPL